MAEYLSIFIPGFEEVVSRWIPRELGGAEILYINGGLAYYRYAGKPEFVAKLPFINNSFVVIDRYKGAGVTFEKMARAASKKTLRKEGAPPACSSGNPRRYAPPPSTEGGMFDAPGAPSHRAHETKVRGTSRTPSPTINAPPTAWNASVPVGRDAPGAPSPGAAGFRVRFSNENTFEKVPKNILEMAEQTIARNYGLYVDRLHPKHEYWFIMRRDEPAYFGRLLKKAAGAKPQKGELRPELACLLCLDCEFNKTTVVCDPYAGYGSIPLHIHKNLPYAKLYVSDSDSALVANLRKTQLGGAPGASRPTGTVASGGADAGVDVTCADATNLKHIGDGAVDYIITDPPWGFVGNYGDISDFYRRAVLEMKRILKPSGAIVLLTGAPAAMADAAARARLTVTSRRNILVNGKKAAVFKLASR